MIRSSKLLLWMVLKIPSSTQNYPPGGALELVIDTMEFSVTQKNIAIIWESWFCVYVCVCERERERNEGSKVFLLCVIVSLFYHWAWAFHTYNYCMCHLSSDILELWFWERLFDCSVGPQISQPCDSLEKTLMLERIWGRRKRGQQRIRWLDGITNTMDMGLGRLRELVMDRKAWHPVIHGVAKGWTRLRDWTELNCGFW